MPRYAWSSWNASGASSRCATPATPDRPLTNPAHMIPQHNALQILRKPRIALLATGGTIAGTAGSATDTRDYTAGQLGPAALLAAVPQLAELARIDATQIFSVDSKDMTPQHWLVLSRRVQRLMDDPAVDGIVITHGTDTLEESAYFLHLTVRSAKPIVLTGAMRPATALAADGPANLLHAVAVAAHPSAAGRGVLVVMNEEIHSARDVSKVHAARLDAFASPHGPLGLVAQGAPRWYRALTRPHTTGSAFDIGALDALPLVGVVASHGNMRAEIYDAWLALGARAIVHAGFGGGTVPEYLKAPLASLRARGVLLVRASRAAAGVLVRNANADDDAHGWVVTDDQNAPRARLLTALALTHTQDPLAVQQIFDCY